MNRLGSGQRRDTDLGPFSPSTGGLDLTKMGSLQPPTWPVLLRQGEPGMPQYISSELFPEHTKHSLRINGISYTKTHSLISTCYIMPTLHAVCVVIIPECIRSDHCDYVAF